jgi:DNA replication protein DnaC
MEHQSDQRTPSSSSSTYPGLCLDHGIHDTPAEAELRKRLSELHREGRVEALDNGKRYRVRKPEEIERARLLQNYGDAAERLWKRSNVPARHRAAHLDAAGPSKWLTTAALLRTLTDEPLTVVLLGGRGTGKTALAAGAIRWFCQHGRAGLYATAMGLFRSIRATFGDRTKTEAGIIDTYAGAGLLVIDEAHLRSDSLFENNTLVDLIDQRYGNLRPSIIIANQDPQQFAAQAGDSITSRLQEAGRVIVCDWPSFRASGTATCHDCNDWPSVWQ